MLAGKRGCWLRTVVLAVDSGCSLEPGDVGWEVWILTGNYRCGLGTVENMRMWHCGMHMVKLGMDGPQWICTRGRCTRHTGVLCIS